MLDLCNYVFQGDGETLTDACDVKYDCEGKVICDKGFCATTMTKGADQPCSDPGAVCSTGNYCTANIGEPAGLHREGDDRRDVQRRRCPVSRRCAVRPARAPTASSRACRAPATTTAPRRRRTATPPPATAAPLGCRSRRCRRRALTSAAPRALAVAAAARARAAVPRARAAVPPARAAVPPARAAEPRARAAVPRARPAVPRARAAVPRARPAGRGRGRWCRGRAAAVPRARAAKSSRRRARSTRRSTQIDLRPHAPARRAAPRTGMAVGAAVRGGAVPAAAVGVRLLGPVGAEAGRAGARGRQFGPPVRPHR